MSELEIFSGEPVNEPTILHQGRYRLYKLPDGGMHVVYKMDGQDEEKHMEVPGQILSMAEGLATGKMNPAHIMKSIMGMMGRVR